MTTARGTFEVTLTPLATEGGLGRFRIEKSWHGDLEGSGQGLTLSAGDPAGGRAGYVAMEVVGNSATMQTAISCVRRGGQIGLVGNVAPEVSLPLQVVVARELTLLGSCASAGEYHRAIKLVASGAIRVAPLVSAVAPLADGPHWFERLYNREPGLIKVILTPT